MAKFLMLGRYSKEGLRTATATRTKEVVGLIEKNGGKVESMYALLGTYDVVFLVEFSSINEIMKASVTLTRLTGISFVTSPAISVDEFDKLAG